MKLATAPTRTPHHRYPHDGHDLPRARGMRTAGMLDVAEKELKHADIAGDKYAGPSDRPRHAPVSYRRAPMTEEERFPVKEAGVVSRKHVTLPPTTPFMGEIGLFNATIPLVMPSGHDTPMMPKVSGTPPIPKEMPKVSKELEKGLHAPATHLPFGMARLEAHGKKNVPVVFRG